MCCTCLEESSRRPAPCSHASAAAAARRRPPLYHDSQSDTAKRILRADGASASLLLAWLTSDSGVCPHLSSSSPLWCLTEVVVSPVPLSRWERWGRGGTGRCIRLTKARLTEAIGTAPTVAPTTHPQTHGRPITRGQLPEYHTTSRYNVLALCRTKTQERD